MISTCRSDTGLDEKGHRMRVRRIIAAGAAGLALAAPALARDVAGLRWERIHVYYAQPSQVFSRLGLDHITRYGHTLGQKRVPDPTFPPGLTDVVPFDPDHTLLVRGTAAGVAQFRQRVEAVDIPEPHWQATLTLLQLSSDAGVPAKVLAQQTQEMVGDTPLVVSFATDGTLPQYQLTVHLGKEGALTLTHRAALTIPAATAADATPDVFVPSQVWTRAMTDPLSPALALTFSDLAADRRQIGQPADENTGDYQVQIQLSPEPATPAPLPAVTPAPGGTPP